MKSLKARWPSLVLSLLTVVSPLLTADAIAAENYPNKLLTMKIAFPAGGPADASFRAAIPVLQRSLGQTVIAESMPGASGAIAAMNVWKSPADGYTLLGTTGTDFIVAPLTIPSAKYRPDDFRLAGVISITDLLLVSSPAHSFKDVDALLEYLKKPNNKELSIAHWGTGSTPHIVGADFQARTGTRLLEVSYKGAAPVSLDVAGSQVDLAFMPLGGPTLGLIQSGKVKPIGIASPTRNPALPNLPTLSESRSLDNFEYTLWTAVFVPPKTPDAIVKKLNDSINEWGKSAENQTRTANGASRVLEPMNPSQASAFLAKEQEKYVRVAKTLKLNP